MAEEYINHVLESQCDCSYRIAFLAGYQAAKDQVANVSKAMPKWNSVDTVGDLINRSAIQHTLAALEKKPAQQWISVKDRLPEDISDVLILSKEKESCVGYYRSSDNDWNMYNPCCSFHMELHGVTHWMPLPAAPKEEV